MKSSIICSIGSSCPVTIGSFIVGLFSFSSIGLDFSKNQIFVEDDASRLVIGYGDYDNATSDNSVLTLSKSMKTYGKAKQAMTDHGVQFISVERETCSEPEPNEFQRFLDKESIQQIKARVKHPQSNGKVEKLGDTLYKLKHAFGSWEIAIEYYNFKRPH